MLTTFVLAASMLLPMPPRFDAFVTKAGTLSARHSHIQGICVSADAVYVSQYKDLYKYDWNGNLLKHLPAKSHAGDMCYADGEVFVVYCGDKNAIEVYDGDMNLKRSAIMPRGADGIACLDGVLYVGNGNAEIPGKPRRGVLFGKYDAKTLKSLCEPVTVDHGHDAWLGVQNIATDGEYLYVNVYSWDRHGINFFKMDRDFKVLGAWQWKEGNGQGFDVIAPAADGSPRFISAVTLGWMMPHPDDPLSQSVQGLFRYSELRDDKFEDMSDWIRYPEPWTRLYNGIEFHRDVRTHCDPLENRNEPLRVPYLEKRPETVCVDIGRQLFIDDFLIEKTSMTRVWHKAKKDPRNPVLKPETPLERGELATNGTVALAAPFSGGVWHDRKDGLYRCFYHAGWFDGTALAYSKDGINWTRPSLNAQPGTNRIVYDPTATRDSAAVVLDPDDPGPARWKMLVWAEPRGGELFVSADGENWSAPHPWGKSGDRSTIFYNPFRKVWCYSIRPGFGAVTEGRVYGVFKSDKFSLMGGRNRWYHESKDFFTDKIGVNGTVRWLRTDNRDIPLDPKDYPGAIGTAPSSKCQLYNVDCVAYESLMLGAFTIMTGPENETYEKNGYPKLTEIHLGFSRDGFHFSRSEDRTAFIPAARKKGAWDCGYLHSNAAICLVEGDELLFYYTGFRGDPDVPAEKHAHPKDRMYANGSMGIARLRRDGFASMDASANGGVLLTRPFVFRTGDRLFANAEAEGGIVADLIDETTREVVASGRKFTGDSTKAELLSGLDAFRNRRVRLRFKGESSKLYSFWFSDKSGRSRGYLAGSGRD